MKMNGKHLWGGFSDGALHAEKLTDNYGTFAGVTLCTSRAEARKRYQDVRMVGVITVRRIRRKARAQSRGQRG